MSHKFGNLEIKFFETFNKVACKVFENLKIIIIILIMATMVIKFYLIVVISSWDQVIGLQ